MHGHEANDHVAGSWEGLAEITIQSQVTVEETAFH